MNKLLLIYGFGLLSSLPIVEEQEDTVIVNKTITSRVVENNLTPFYLPALKVDDTLLHSENFEELTKPLHVYEIQFLEEEEEIDLGFDTSEYLPSNFNPYDSAINVKFIHFMEEDKEIELGVDTFKYLPENFDSYANVN